ncbi:MAG: antitoxin [Proteobacteria bacterium]|nr:antitoxin [Pseudomonadota bacterium]
MSRTAKTKPARREYDFTKAKPNPYARKLKKPVTIRLDESTVRYFKKLAEELELPYQSLINLYLRDCANSGRTLAMKWTPKSGRVA